MDLSIREKGQLVAWSHSEPSDRPLGRNSSIILKLADGHLVNEVAKVEGVCRQTVSKVRRYFLIFGLDGIERRAPRLGRKPTIKGDRANTVLQIALSEVPLRGFRWTGQQLAMRCELPHPTISRFLKRNEISLEDPRTIKDALEDAQFRILGIAGLFLSTSICIMALSCKPRNGPLVIAPISTTTGFKIGNASVFFSGESERLLRHLVEIQGEISRMKPKRTDYTDVLMFMDILNDKDHPQRETMLVSDSPDIIAASRLTRWMMSHPRFHFAASTGDERWISILRVYLNSVSEVDKRLIAFQLEHLNAKLGEWRRGPYMRLGVFASINPLLNAQSM